jgi:hypothetical protein
VLRTREADLKLWKFPDQVLRLAILFAVAGALLLWVRHRFVPATFGLLGHYRAAAVAANTDRAIHYAGREACVECHTDEGQVLAASFHRTLSCEVCHGPAADHAEAPDEHHPFIPRERGAACLFCHEYLASRPTGFPQIIERNHNPAQPCIQCHRPHDPTPPEVPESCAACHTEIWNTKAVSHHASLSCVTCHNADPAHMQHPRSALPTKPTERQFCGRCHDVNASSPANIPRVDLATHGAPYLCWQCHYPHSPES